MELNAYGMNKQTFEEDKELCYLVKQHPQLYDKGHKYYGQKNAIDKAWRTIADSLGKSVPACKARWEILCDYIAYIRAINPDEEQHEDDEDDEDDEDYIDNLLCHIEDMTQQEPSNHISIFQVIHKITEMKICANEDCIQNGIEYLADKIDEQEFHALQQIMQKKQ
ncbi:uncharacterized protein LOC105227930 [Bactrocera dorsalis]|uniref:Uncharacterized protein LOC105227930 n=1 Tax=Bactrocera dorsalis TaxID=27457 RepID=A0A6I9VPH2_BACDO|nr:uncharacterized protein LOC105227930 [Bactrocera dorsalis]